MRFVVRVASVTSAPNPRYFGRRKGLTWLNYLNDRVAGLSAVVIPGTIRDSLYILDGLLDIDLHHRPDMIATDTASYSDQVFGLFALLGYRFSPRLADLPDQRFWTASPTDNYGALAATARNKLDIDLIAAHWDDMLRVAGSLVTGRVRAADLLRVTRAGGSLTALGRAIAEYGRIAKTSTCSTSSTTTTPTVAKSTTNSTSTSPARRSPGACSTDEPARSTSPTAKAKKTSSSRSGSCSTPSSCGTPDTSTLRSTSSDNNTSRSPTTTSPASHHCSSDPGLRRLLPFMAPVDHASSSRPASGQPASFDLTHSAPSRESPFGRVIRSSRARR